MSLHLTLKPVSKCPIPFICFIIFNYPQLKKEKKKQKKADEAVTLGGSSGSESGDEFSGDDRGDDSGDDIGEDRAAKRFCPVQDLEETELLAQQLLGDL